MLHPPGHGQEAEPIIDGAGKHLDDYYQLLNVRPGFSDLQLLRRFLRGCRQAMNAGDHAILMSVRRGFEVLRYEDTRISYYRMHRLLVQKEPLRFPIMKQREMLQDIRSKEALASGRTNPVIDVGTTYFELEMKVISQIMFLDLSRIWRGASGLIFLIGSLMIIVANKAAPWSIAVALLMSAWGLFALKLRASDYVTYPE